MTVARLSMIEDQLTEMRQIAEDFSHANATQLIVVSRLTGACRRLNAIDYGRGEWREQLVADAVAWRLNVQDGARMSDRLMDQLHLVVNRLDNGRWSADGESTMDQRYLARKSSTLR